MKQNYTFFLIFFKMTFNIKHFFKNHKFYTPQYFRQTQCKSEYI